MIPAGLDPARLFQAIGTRRSTRTFRNEPLAPDVQQAISALAQEIAIFDDVRVDVIHGVPDGFFTGIIGSYFPVTGAPSAIVFSRVDGTPRERWHAGYLGEALVLEATARGIATCWVGGSYSAGVVKETTGLDDRPIIVIALGHDAGEAPKTAKRRTLESIAPGHERWPLWAREAAECVRIAPSSMNRQLWQLELDRQGRMTVRTPRALIGVGGDRRLGGGIAGMHVELAAARHGVHGAWNEADLDAFVFEPVGAIPLETAAPARAAVRLADPIGVHASKEEPC